ncbi:MAG: hypothetical protein LBO78_02040 [Rickettsiales bacterium]|jgi:hypothetical protein|nr:hypothetical protein [Rickettsiales bacterium]
MKSKLKSAKSAKVAKSRPAFSTAAPRPGRPRPQPFLSGAQSFVWTPFGHSLPPPGVKILLRTKNPPRDVSDVHVVSGIYEGGVLRTALDELCEGYAREDFSFAAWAVIDL